MTDPICVFGAWVCYNPKRFEQCTENKEKAEKLGDISLYPEIKFGPLTVLDFLDLVELQAETYTTRALTAEKTLRAIISKVKEWDNPHQRDRHAAPSIVHDLEGLLELPQEGDEE